VRKGVKTVEESFVPLHVLERIVRPGSELRGHAVHGGTALVRFRGEAITYRPQSAEAAAAAPSGWLSESQVLLWQERDLRDGESEFSFEIPADCVPSALGQRMRIAYYLELCGHHGCDRDALEIAMVAGPAGPALERKVALNRIAGAAEAAAGGGLDELLASKEPQSWLEQFLAGKNRMDRILERAVRGKLVEPEELLAMQATMYGYSRNLLQIRPGRRQASGVGFHRTHEEPESDAGYTLERDTLAAGDRLRIHLELPPAEEAADAALLLTQRERTRCHGLETVLEQVVQSLRRRVRGGDWLELELPAGLPATVAGPQCEVSYVLSMTLAAGEDVLQGSTGLQVFQSSAAPRAQESSAGPPSEAGAAPPSAAEAPASGGSRVS
jgi:hypothetical protein